MIKSLIKWTLKIVVLAVVLITLLLVFKDTILRIAAEHQIRAETGMDVKIGRFSSGLFSPVVTIENMKLYNTPEFGGTEFLIIPELHIEFDPEALAEQKVRIKLLRFNLAELDVVRNFAGETNVVSMMKKVPKGKLAPHGIEVGKKKFEFESIEVLNLSLGRIRFLDLKHPEKNREVQINLDNEVLPNIKTDGDLLGIYWWVMLKRPELWPRNLERSLSTRPAGQQLERAAPARRTN